MRLHTVFVTYNRLELTKQAIESYLETVSVPHSWLVVDNNSSDGTTQWLWENYPLESLLLPQNRYPGAATNAGWRLSPGDATHLQRADNDNRFLPGWCEHVQERFAEEENLGQLGLRTAEWDQHCRRNVSGDCIISRELWDKGIRWQELLWSEYPPGVAESAGFADEVTRLGYRWSRVTKPCIEPIAAEDPNDPYYIESWRSRGILEWALARHAKLAQ